MAVQQYYVDVQLPNGTSRTTLGNVQSASFKTGRESQLDQYSTTTGTVVIRQPSTPSALLIPGNQLIIWWDRPGSAFDIAQFIGNITNVSLTYGIPYAGGVANADYLTVTLEGQFAQAGRVSGAGYAMAADTALNQFSAARTASGLQMQIAGNGFNTPIAATTVNGTWADWLASVALTINGRILDNANGVTVRTPFFSEPAVISFSDTTNDATNQVYDNITFDALADNYYTQVTVDPESYAAQTVQTGAIPYRTYSVNTLNSSTGQALDYANYLLNNYKTPRFAISSISCLANAQNDFKLYDLSNTFSTLQAPYRLPGVQIAVTFRGTTYACIIEGVAVSIVPGEARYTYYVSGADLNAYLILDNATFGKLDSNRLGY